jgi:hypothetical protein
MNNNYNEKIKIFEEFQKLDNIREQKFKKKFIINNKKKNEYFF